MLFGPTRSPEETLNDPREEVRKAAGRAIQRIREEVARKEGNRP